MKYFRRGLIFFVIVFIPYLLAFGFDFFFGIPGKADGAIGVSRTLVKNLPHKVKETSGLIFFENDLWTFNDSGGEPELYAIDPHTGKIKRTLKIANAVNRDWEDIAVDSQYIYIGDFGNNLGNRRDLCIYKVPIALVPDDTVYSTVTAELIRFHFPDQKSFTFSLFDTPFDCEAMIAPGDSLIVFTKDWRNHKTAAYSLSKSPGKQIARLIGRFDVQGLVTGADFEDTRSLLVLCGYAKQVPFIWMFSLKNNTRLFSNPVKHFTFPSIVGAQTEGVIFHGHDSILLSAEESAREPALYSIDY